MRIKLCTCSIRTKFTCARILYVSRWGITAKFKTANIFISAAQDQTAKLKDRQYFRPYGILNGYQSWNDQVLLYYFYWKETGTAVICMVIGC